MSPLVSRAGAALTHANVACCLEVPSLYHISAAGGGEGATACCVASDICASVSSLVEWSWQRGCISELACGSQGLLCVVPGGRACSGCSHAAQLPGHIKSGERATLSHVTFVFLGWTSRTQFEETWATLLGVLVTQPLVMEQEESPPEVRLHVGPRVHWLAPGQSRQLVTCSWGAKEGQQARVFGLNLGLPGQPVHT